jgi:hypothetical protein
VSNRLLNLAWRVTLPAPAKILLVALADRADDSGKSWPSREVLARQTGLSEVSLWRRLRELVDAGLVSQQRRRQASAVYVVHEDALTVAATDSDRVGIDEAPVGGETFQPETFHDETSQPKTLQAEGFQDERSGAKTFQPETQDISQRNLPKGNPQRTPNKKSTTDEPRQDVDRLCAALVEHRVRLGCKRPTVTATWRQQARLLLDADKRPLDEVLAVLDWSQRHEPRNGFSWAANVQSMPKFREKYDQLRLQREADPKAAAATPGRDHEQWLREQWQEGRVTEIQKVYNIGYQRPDPGAGDYWADVLKPYNRRWIEQHRDAILARLTSEAVS